MKTIAKLLIGTLVFLWMWGCGASLSTSGAINDTYLTTKERAKINQQIHQSSNTDVDIRSDNHDTNDYAYTRRIRRYYTGVWYDPWFDPWWSPSWTWRSAWWGPAWGWRLHTGWAMMSGWYYTSGWGWTYYAGPTWHEFGWTGWMYDKRYNYTPRTYTTTSGNTTYKPPRNSSVSNQNTNPSRRITMPASSSYMPASSGNNIRTSSGSTRPR